jgi:hypothetical protein
MVKYFYEVAFEVVEKGEIYKSETIGLMHGKKCTNTVIISVIKRILPMDKKNLDVHILKAKPISEEDAKRNYPNKLINVVVKPRNRSSFN